MRKRAAGLVAAGGVNLSFLGRLRPAIETIGLVKGLSLRVSRRIANGLRSGKAITEYRQLAPTRVLWLYAPEEMLTALCRELTEAISLAGKIVIVCDTPRASSSFARLLPGARVATLNPVPEFEEKLLVCEGDGLAVKHLRRLLNGHDGRKLLELRSGAKSLYLSGLLLSAHTLLPLFAASVESFRAAGLRRAQASRMAQTLGAAALRSYVRGGDRAWNEEVFRQLLVAVDYDDIAGTDPRLAELCRRGSECLPYFFANSRAARAGGRPH